MSYLLIPLLLVGLQNPSESAVGQFELLQARAKNRLAIESRERGRTKSQSIAVGIDSRMELMTIIFRLAGNDEFRSDGLKPYADYIDSRFAAFKDHPAVRYARTMREKRGVCCDAVVRLAIHVGDVPDMKIRARLDNPILGLRWRPDEAKRFVELARDFAVQSDFGGFLKENEPLYRLTELRMRRLVDRHIDQKWFAGYFGRQPNARFIVAPGLLNGSISYGTRVQPERGQLEMYASIGTWTFDKEGLPSYDNDAVGTVVHEFGHSFVNPAVEKNEALLQTTGEPAQKVIADRVQGMGIFEWSTMVEETLVRAVVARYIHAKQGAKPAQAELTQQSYAGFIWLDDVFALLGDYESSRSRYPTFESFLPRVRDYYEKIPTLLTAQLEKIEPLRPHVQSVEPAPGSNDVDPALAEIRVTFDRPIMRGSYATVPGETGPTHFPPIMGNSLDASGTMLTMKVRLKPDFAYEMYLNSKLATGFRSREGVPLSPFHIHFHTRPA